MKKRMRKKLYLGPFSKTGKRPAYCANCAMFDIDRMTCSRNGDESDFDPTEYANTSCYDAIMIRIRRVGP